MGIWMEECADAGAVRARALRQEHLGVLWWHIISEGRDLAVRLERWARTSCAGSGGP